MDEGAARPPGKRMTARRRGVAALLAVLLLALLGLWSQRKPIARNFVDAELRARDVSARYTIAALAPGVQRLTGVVIGDPARPDLTADEVVLRLRYRFGWPAVAAIEARGVRLRGRVVGGRVSFGTIDRLLPPPSDAPFTLPELRVDLTDVRVALATPAGGVDLTVAGRGRLSDGFAGRLGARAESLAAGGCAAEMVTAHLAVRIAARRPHLSGPLAARALRCAGVAAETPRVMLHAALEESFALRRIAATLASGRIAVGDEAAGAARGSLTYDATDPRNRHGDLALTATAMRSRLGVARSLRWQGPYRIGGVVSGGARPLRTTGSLTLLGGRVPAADKLGRSFSAMAGTPLAPLADATGRAIAAAAREFDLSTQLAFDGDVGGRRALAGEVRAERLALASRSGARAAFAGDGARFLIGAKAPTIAGVVTLAGGGLPEARVVLRQQAAGAPLAGTATIAPYAAGGARLALAPVRFEHTGAGLRFATTATLDGPIGDGRVRGLSLPLAGVAGEVIEVNRACVPLSFASLALAGMELGATRLPLCPRGGAMLRVAGGRVSGGFAVPRPRLAGRVGGQPLTIAAADLRVDLSRNGFAADTVAVRLGGAGGTRLDLARLDGRPYAGGLGGRFTGGAGAIANVPLLLTAGTGTWRLAGGRLGVKAAATVSDAAVAPRFLPLVTRDIALDLSGGVIGVTGTLHEPGSGIALTHVAIRHDLGTGAGGAGLAVQGITFGPAFQPEAITPLTLGVVANVVGRVSGVGRIDWNGKGVTSSGDFATENLDLAAAFGPVTGISTKIHFSDLLALETPPGQLVTVAAFNPGIAVEGGVVGYQLLPGQKVAVGGGKWPFSGGSLILEPTVLDFGQPVARHLTFRVEGLDAARFLERFDFKNIAATGLFDGSLPMVFDASGGRITGGRLTVRAPGGTLAYVGELTNKDLGLFGKLAFDALKSIRYSNLTIELDGALESEIVSRIVFTGTNESPKDEKPTGLLKDLTGLPFRFNIVVRAPFRALTGAAEAFVNPRGLIGGAARPGVPEAVKPPLSEDQR